MNIKCNNLNTSVLPLLLLLLVQLLMLVLLQLHVDLYLYINLQIIVEIIPKESAFNHIVHCSLLKDISVETMSHNNVTF